MDIKRGNVVSHPGAVAWGVGKVLDVAPLKATIQFSDGIIRKIASSHYTLLQPANPASFVLISYCEPVVAARPTPKRKKKIKQPPVSTLIKD
jgi:hypothetical protein